MEAVLERRRVVREPPQVRAAVDDEPGEERGEPESAALPVDEDDLPQLVERARERERGVEVGRRRRAEREVAPGQLDRRERREKRERVAPALEYDGRRPRQEAHHGRGAELVEQVEHDDGARGQQVGRAALPELRRDVVEAAPPRGRRPAVHPREFHGPLLPEAAAPVDGVEDGHELAVGRAEAAVEQVDHRRQPDRRRAGEEQRVRDPGARLRRVEGGRARRRHRRGAALRRRLLRRVHGCRARSHHRRVAARSSCGVAVAEAYDR